MGKVELKLEVDADLLARARAVGAEPQRLLEDALRHATQVPRPLGLVESAREKAKDAEGAARRAREWREANTEAIAEHDARIAERGLFSETVPRRW